VASWLLVGEGVPGIFMTDASSSVHCYRHSNWHSLHQKTVVAKSSTAIHVISAQRSGRLPPTCGPKWPAGLLPYLDHCLITEIVYLASLEYVALVKTSQANLLTRRGREPFVPSKRPEAILYADDLAIPQCHRQRAFVNAEYRAVQGDPLASIGLAGYHPLIAGAVAIATPAGNRARLAYFMAAAGALAPACPFSAAIRGAFTFIDDPVDWAGDQHDE
jgi:hypothetical protein